MSSAERAAAGATTGRGEARRRPGRRFLIAALVVAVALGGVEMLGQTIRQMIYPAPPVRVPSPPPQPLVEVPLAAEDGARISAWWLPPPRPGAPAVLMLHGNGENLETMRQAGLFEQFGALGAGVIAVDYPGYGRSAGSASEEGNVAAALAAWRWLREHHRGPRLIAGWSLGAAVAVQTAGRAGAAVDALVLLSAWDRLAEVAVLHFPPWLVETALPERYDSLLAASRVRSRSLVVHGDTDEIIPARLGRRLFAALPEPKRWVEVPHAGHNDLLGRPEVWQALRGLLAELPGPPVGG